MAGSMLPDSGERPLHFLKMPGEIRNRIYTFVLVQYNGVWIDSESFMSGPGVRSTAIHPALASTCRTIRREALSVYYSENCFTLDTFDISHELHKWIKLRGPLLRMVSKVSIGYGYGSLLRLGADSLVTRCKGTRLVDGSCVIDRCKALKKRLYPTIEEVCLCAIDEAQKYANSIPLRHEGPRYKPNYLHGYPIHQNRLLVLAGIMARMSAEAEHCWKVRLRDLQHCTSCGRMKTAAAPPKWRRSLK